MVGKEETERMRWSGIIVAWLIVLGAIRYGSEFLVFVDLPSLLMTVVGGHAAAAAVYGADAFRVVVPSYGRELGARALRITKSIGHFYVLAGWVGALIGAVHMGNAGDVLNRTNFGPSFAVCVLTLFYAYLMQLGLWAPLAAHYEDVLSEP